MDLWMQSVDVFQAATVLLSDWPQEQVDALFLHARSHGDDDGLFELANELYHSGTVKAVVINGSDGERRGSTKPGEAWPGKAVYLERLKALNIANLLLSKPAFDNKHENELFLELAVGHGWRSAAILTQPHQMLRTFLGWVKSMADHEYRMRLYVVTPKFTPWWKVVHGSQGAKAIQRFDHIEEEFKRVPLYQQKGGYGKDGRDLATFEELFKYLRHRSYIA